MAEWSTTIDSISNVSTSALLAMLLAVMVYFQWQNDREWNNRLAAILERQAQATERHAEQSLELANILDKIWRERDAATHNRN